jgi:replication factor C subunit 3/5|tara:strand:+ start:275 stop:1270 length:996 start_codon:yes stop_codon:yes gene_type:complete
MNSKDNNTNEDIPWVEKYRPNHFDNIVLDPINRNLFKQIINKEHFPNLLFYGPPGTGKTTTIINLIQEYQKTHGKVNRGNVIHLNASDERGIDIIRNQIHSFVKTMNLFETGFKFVILDEVDYMTKNAQQALKYLLQTTTTKVRFCLICNYISKIDEPLKNEFICVRFNQLPKNEITQFINTIVKKEEIKISNDAIYTIQSMYKSDIRSMINFLQLNQNFKLNEWNKNILNPSILNDLHNMFCTKAKQIDIKNKICKISQEYNIDKKHLLQCYFNHVIRFKLVLLNNDFIEYMKKIIHTTNADMQDIIQYMIVKQNDLTFRPSPYVVSSSA